MNITQPGQHLDHMLKQTRNYHVQLVSMADLKANLLLTVSTVVLTLSVRYIADPSLKWSAVVLIAFCLLTIVLAIYTVMPKIPIKFRREPELDVNSAKFNLLFFGDFLRLDYDEYERTMEDTLNDHSRTYQAMVKEIYILGEFLAKRKYRVVRLAYVAFLTGFLASGLVLVLSGIGR